ncbi:MAG: hypothetical protein ACI8S6_002798 [Myxococcota bacterium]
MAVKIAPIIVAAGVLFCGPAHAEGATWAVLPMLSSGTDPQAAAVFRDLLQHELSTRSRAGFVAGGRPCPDVPCAIAAGEELGVQRIAFGSLSQLGGDLIVAVTAVDVVQRSVLSSQKITVDQLEDLDAAADRIAAAIMAGSTTESTARLGNITAAEVAPARRREGLGGLGLRVGGLIPIRDGYADGLPGVLIDASYWYETDRFAIEPRIGFRFDASGQQGGYLEIPMDLGAYAILGRGDFAPFIGGGAGVRYLSDSRARSWSTGEVIVMTHTELREDSTFGFGAFGRAGLLLLRTYSLRVALTVDYNVTFVDLNGTLYPRSLTAGIGAYF